MNRWVGPLIERETSEGRVWSILDGKYSSTLKFALFLTIIFCLGVGISTASAKTYCVDDDPSSLDGIECNSSIQEAVDAASDGDTIIVRDGTYYENVNVDKQLTIRSENGSGNCIVDVGGSGNAFTLSSDGITVEGFTAINSEWGVWIYSSDNNIHDCNFSYNRYDGIYLDNSDNNTIRDTKANHNGYSSVFLTGSSNNVLINITATNNGDFGGIYAEMFSINNSIRDCNITDNQGPGIWIYDNCDNTNIKSCNVSANGEYGYDGISIFSQNNTITRNIINSNTQSGILLYGVNNVVEDNIVKLNGYCGIDSSYSGHVIRNNTISMNYDYGICMWGSDSLIYNNILNNTQNYYDTSSSNTWNSTNTTGTNIIGGNRLGGNAWFWPNGTGYSQECSDTNGDSFCDKPLVLNANNTDYLPLALTGIDSIPPSVSIISPQNTTYLASTISINATATDASGISEVKAQIDGSNITLSCENGYYVNSKSLSDGNHWIRIFAEDTAGNTNSDEIVYFSTTTTVSNCTVISSPGYYHLTDNITNSSSSKCIIINSSDVVFDGSGFRVDGVDTYGTYGVYVGDNSLDNVTVRNLTATDWTYGIYYENSHNGLIENNYLQSNRYGLYLDNSTNNTLGNNQMTNNTYNFDIYADSPAGFYNHINTTNLVQGRSIYYLFDVSDLLIDSSSNAGLVYCINSDNITVRDSVFSHNKKGVYFLNTTNSRVENNVFTHNDYGIYLNSSSSNNITSNNATENNYGYYLYNSTQNLVDSNTALDNGEGIKLFHNCSENTITKNNCSNNGLGIGIGGYEIDYTCYNNTVYLNYLMDNGENAQDPTLSNHWNSTSLVSYEYNGTPFSNYTGNYWSDYTGLDNNSDGIGDSPYDISAGMGESSAKDYYPMILTFEEAPVISNLQQGTPTNNSVTISWQTNMGSNNRILFNENQNLSSGSWSEWHNNTLNPEITLTDLAGNTTYYYSVYSYNRDNFNLYSNSSVYNFTTIRDNVVWIVDDDGLDCEANFTTIQDAVNASIDGDTIIVCTGTYVENIMVSKSLNITGLNITGRPLVDANKQDSGFTLVSNGNIIQGFNITNAAYSGSNYWGYKVGGGGVRVGYTSYWSSKMDYHMHYGSSNNIIRDNYFINNGRQGVIVVWNSNHNTITRNHFENDGVSILYGRYNNVTYNHFNGTNPEPFIKIDREVEPSFDFSLYNRIEDNTITGVSTSLYPMLFPLIEISNHLNNNIVCSNNLSTTGKGGISVSSDRNLIINNTITGRGGLPDPDDIGIKLYYVKDCIVSNNTIELLHKGIYIDTSSGYVHSTNLTMKNNRMVNNLYHFYILTPQDVVAEGSPAFNDFDHDIDNSNIIMDGAAEKRIYYFKDVSDQIFDFSDAGFFACINCRNITVRYLTLKDNSHGILLFNTSDSLIGDVYVHKNHLAGISIYNSNNVTVNNTWIANNGGDDNEGKGVYLSLTDNTKLENCLIETNWCEGVNFDHSYGNTVSHSNITDNGPGSPDDYCSRGSGIRFIESDENTVHSNYILATAIPTYGGWTGGQTYGIYMFGAFSNNNTIYNNYFNSSGNAYDRRHDSAQDGGHNFWNITKTPGTNIIGGSYLGGNYWSDYAGADTTGEDGLGDTQVPYNSSGNIINGGDYHPLTVPGNDTTPPELSITSPVEGKNYGANYVYLKVYSPDSDVHSWWYSINNRSNVSFTPNTTITGLSNGQHSLVVYVNDTSGNVNYSIVNFTISVSTGGVSGGGSGFAVQEPLEEIEEEEVEFDIIITSPEDKRYTDREITLSYTSSVPLKRTSYILDGSTPVELQPLAPLTISRLTLGEHVLIVNGEDYYGMRGRAEVSFEVIPLTLGELESAGTPEFPEDVAFSFMGRSVDHKLTLEANIDGEVEVYINKFLKEENGNKTLQDYTDNGELIGLMNDTGWATYEFNISADVLVPDAENIISFIHLNNSQGIDSEQWRIRNLNLIPRLDTQAPQIEVFTLDKSIAEGEELEFYVKIDGITNESAFDAYIYLLSPDGIIRYYSDWGDQQTLDPYYLRNNYYGRLPESLEFNGFVPGTYVMVGKIVEKGDTYPIALSTEKIYYDPQVSTRIYVDQVFTDGEELVIEHALTPGIEAGNGTVIISLEDPDHNRVYLPALSERIWGKSYSPLTSEFFTVFTGRVDSSWKNGTYVIRSDVYSDEGNLLAEDMRMFDICRETSKLSGRYIFDTFSSISLSQIQLIHANTLEIIENEITGGHSSYSINAPPGDYYLVGKAYGGDGRVFNIPLTPITLKCGEEVRRNIILRDTGVTFSEQEMEDMGLFMGSYNYDTLGESNSIISSLKSISFQENQDSCSKPKVYLMVGPPWNTSQVDQELVAKYERLTKQSSTNIKVYSYSDIRNVLAEQEQLLTENPGAEVDVSAVRQMVNADYLLRFSYTTLGSDYVMNSAILDVDRVEVVHGVSTSGSNRDSVLSNLIVSQGDIGATIRTWEMNKLPPRDPTISPALEPDTVTLEEGKNKATMKVRVVDCKGNPVEGARVYFDQITDRGYVKAEGGVEHYSGYVYSTTDENGNADATYVLNKGSKAGKDIMDIFVKARGNKKVHQKAVINIAGIGIEIVPEEEELSPGEDTLIHISLYSEDEKGERTPLKGKMILVEKYALLDSKISVLGECYEGTSNPVTDQDGKATLKFIAGKKEGLIKIPVSYQSLSYEDSVRDTTLIKVKKDEFIISIKWNEYNEYSRYYSTFIFQDETSGIYWYSFESKTIWDKRSGRESTTATLSLNSHVYGSTEENRVWSGCADWVASPFGHKCISDSETLLYKSTRKGVGNYNANVNSRITDVETVNTKLKQDVAGNLWIHIEPIRISMPLSGNLEGKSYSQYIKESSPWESLQWTTIDSSSSEENLDIDYSGSNKNPNPAYQADCILSIPEAKRWTGCKYFSGLDFPGNYVKLTKTGENTYGAYHYFWGDRGDYSWRDDIFESSNLVEYEIRRGFDVTVVKR